jgi:hypothetical protein
MELSQFADLHPESDETVDWWTDARYGPRIAVGNGILVRTTRRIAFLADRRQVLGRRLHWESSRDDVTGIVRLDRWDFPLIGIVRNDRVLIRSRTGHAAFIVPTPQDVIAALCI